MQTPNRGLTERRGEVFLLDILSHRMSVIGDLSFAICHAPEYFKKTIVNVLG
jgi:hypothetical protein